MEIPGPAPAAASREESQSKRTNYINWDEYFMGVAFLCSKRSKDPSTQVGACIVNNDKQIIGSGIEWTNAHNVILVNIRSIAIICIV